MPVSLFGRDLNTVTTKEIDKFIFGGNGDTTNKASKYSAPPITSESNIEPLLPSDEATATTDFDAVLISDTSIPQTVDDPEIPSNTGDVSRGNAYRSMETAIIGEGKRSRTDVKGSRSFINPLAIIHHANCNDVNDFLDDETQGFGAYKKSVSAAGTTQDRRELTLDGLLKDFPDNIGQESSVYSTPYRIGDFLFCKYFQRIPLNHMITLRRFAHPTYDNLTWGSYNNESGTTGASKSDKNIIGKSKSKSQSKSTSNKNNVNADAVNKSSASSKGTYNFKPIAQAVTFFGESTGNDLDKITSIKGEILWKELNADVNKYEQDSSNGLRSAEDTPGASNSRIISGIAKSSSILLNRGDRDRSQAVNDGNQISLFDAHWANKTYGPVDSITKTQIRDRGVHATYKIDLVFEYELRSYAGINPRIAMLDIIANMLALTFNNAKFWGGANIFFPNHPQFAFLGGKKAQDELYSGRYSEYLTTVFNEAGAAFGKGLDILQSIGAAIMNMDIKSAVSTIAKNLGGVVGDLVSAKSRPATMAVRSLITGQPNGCWHLTVGNPYRPILKMGNLIVKDWEMSFGGFMGVDDFPSEVKYRVTLETCRPVDKGGVESWLNGVMESRTDGKGSGRLYYASKELRDGVGKKTMTDLKVTDKTTTGRIKITNKDLINTESISDAYAVNNASTQINQASGSLF